MKSNSQQKILVISPSIPKPDCNAGDRRFFAILQLLAKHYSVNLWMASGPLSDPESLRYVRQISELSIKVLNDTYNLSINEVLTQDYYQVIFFEFYWMAEPFLDTCRRYQPHAKVVVDSVDVSFARELIAAELGVIEKKQAEETKRKELNLYGKVDAVQSINPESKELVFIGGFKWEPNIDGIQWFVKEIWGSIRSRIPEAVITVIGSNPTEEILELGKTLGVNVVGYVPDTNPYLKRAAISIAPLRYGGGMKGKVNEAMSIGLPVVTTSVGAQGLNAISGKHLLIADEPLEFAEAVISLLESSSYRTEMGLAGQQLTADLCSPAIAEKVIRDMLDLLISQKQSFPPLLARVRYIVLIFILKNLGLTRLLDLAKRFRRKVKSFSTT
jgi:O-antigen biosynthesis protein